MATEVRVTTTVAKVLRVFLEDASQPRYGFELMRLAGLPSGTLYPALARLESVGWLSSYREDVDPVAEGRPPRRFYRISEKGAREARCELTALSEQLRPPTPLLSRVHPRWEPA
jgi:DNA-binding PadR family transcriptional regulator